MAHARLNPIAWWWRRRKLQRQLVPARLGTSGYAKRLAIEALRRCPLYVAVRRLPNLPNLPTDAAGRLTADVPVTMLTSEGPEGKVMFVFTSRRELRKRNAAAGAVVTDLAGVIGMLPDEMAGVVIDPEGGCLFLSREEIGAPPAARRSQLPTATPPGAGAP